MTKHFIVTNIDVTTQAIMDHQGQMRLVSPGKSLLMEKAPKESYIFHVVPLTHEEEKKYFEEFKTEGSELKTEAEVKAEKQEENKKQKEVKK